MGGSDAGRAAYSPFFSMTSAHISVPQSMHRSRRFDEHVPFALLPYTPTSVLTCIGMPCDAAFLPTHGACFSNFSLLPPNADHAADSRSVGSGTRARSQHTSHSPSPYCFAPATRQHCRPRYCRSSKRPVKFRSCDAGSSDSSSSRCHK